MRGGYRAHVLRERYDDAHRVKMSGVNGAFLSSPDSAALSITGDIDIRLRLAMDDWTPGAKALLVGKWRFTDNNRSFEFALNTDGTMLLRWSTDGTAGTIVGSASTVPVAVSDRGVLNVRVTLDVDNGASGFDLRYYTGFQADLSVDSWTQLGSTVVGGAATSIFDGASILHVGSDFDGNGASEPHDLYRVQIRSGINGTIAFDSDISRVPTGISSFAESSSNAATVTIGGTAVVAA